MSTIKDVAKKAEVSVTTVSRIINHQGHFSQKTIERVHQVMKELNYQPNEVARTLGSRKSRTLALVLPNAELPIFGLYTAEIEKAAYEKGYRLTLCSSFLDTEKELKSIELLKNNMVDGIIYSGFNTDISHFQNIDIPAVTIGRKVSPLIPVVQSDNHMAGKLAYRHLTAKGCKNLLYITSYPSGIDDDEKYKGIQEMCAAATIPCYPYGIPLEMQLSHSLDSIISQALFEHPDADGIITETDLIAMKTIQMCSSFGINVPEQIKIIGFGNHFYSQYCTPPLTTIEEPIRQISSCAVDALIRCINDNETVTDITVPVSIIERKTT